MGGVRMCADCRRRKVKCEPHNKDNLERTWDSEGLQEKCIQCKQHGFTCGPPQYANQQSPPRKGQPHTSRRMSVAGPSVTEARSAASPADRICSAARSFEELARDKLELKRRLNQLDLMVEGLQVLRQRIDLAEFPDYTTLRLPMTATYDRALSLLRLAIPLADGLAAAEETDAAENAYIRMLGDYRTIDPNARYEVKGLLRKLASMLSKLGQHQRAQNYMWEALKCRDTPARADRSDLEWLRDLARSLTCTSNDLADIIQPIADLTHLQQVNSPIPVLHRMMESDYASIVTGNLFWSAPLPDPNDLPEPPFPVDGGISTILDFVRELPLTDLYARDYEGRSPLYMAAVLGKEPLGLAIMMRADEAPQSKTRIMDARDQFTQTILGIAICSRCSLQFIDALITYGADVNPDMESLLNPLQAASFLGSMEVVDLLLNRGATNDRTLPGGKTAIELAQEQGHYGIVQRLRRVSQGSPRSSSRDGR